jgi:hypothetical protein
VSGSEIGFLLDDVKRKADKAKGIEAKALEINAKGVEAKGADLFNPEILHKAISSAKGHRKTISVWSPLISATMWYLKATTPLFSISDVTKEWIEEAMRREHPELVKKIEEEMGKND